MNEEYNRNIKYAIQACAEVILNDGYSFNIDVAIRYLNQAQDSLLGDVKITEATANVGMAFHTMLRKYYDDDSSAHLHYEICVREKVWVSVLHEAEKWTPNEGFCINLELSSKNDHGDADSHRKLKAALRMFMAANPDWDKEFIEFISINKNGDNLS